MNPIHGPPLEFDIPRDVESLKAWLDLKEALELFEDKAGLLIGRLSAKEVWAIIEQFLIIARMILQAPHWSESPANPGIISTGEVDELNNEKLVKRRTNKPFFVPTFSEAEQRWFDQNLQVIHDRLLKGYISCVSPKVGRGVPKSADLFYTLRQMSKQKKGAGGSARGKRSLKGNTKK